MDVAFMLLGLGVATLPDVAEAQAIHKVRAPVALRSRRHFGHFGPNAFVIRLGEEKKEKAKSINFMRPTAGGSFKKSSNASEYFEANGNVTGFDPLMLPDLYATMYDALDNTESWAGFPKEQPSTDMGAWRFHFMDIMQTMDNERDYVIIVETMDPPPDTVSASVNFEISADGSFAPLKKAFAGRPLSYSRAKDIRILPFNVGQLGRTLVVRGWITPDLAHMALRGSIFHRKKPTQPSIAGRVKYQGPHGYWRIDFPIPTTNIEPDNDYTVRVSTFGGVAMPAEAKVRIVRKAGAD